MNTNIIDTVDYHGLIYDVRDKNLVIHACMEQVMEVVGIDVDDLPSRLYSIIGEVEPYD
jgi:hypothetical protein